jgi:hypothetical protein
MMLRSAFPYIVGAAVLAAIVAGLVLIGPPSTERSRRLDLIRLADLRQLARGVDLYWGREKTLPPAVPTLATVPDALFRSTMDPSTGEPYSYRALDGSRYELCATFEAADDAGNFGDPFWSHGAGRKCFELDAEKRQMR